MSQAEKLIRRHLNAFAELKGDSKGTTGPVGYLIGAAYGLLCASQLGYRALRVRDAVYAAELRAIARHLGSVGATAMETRGRRAWLARLHFNSALHRLAAAADRLDIHPRGQFPEPSSLRRIRDEVNKLKHDIKQRPSQRAKGLLEGREVPMRMALAALSHLARHCRREGLI